MRKAVLSVLPDLNNDRTGPKGKYIVLGAGEYGEKAQQILNEDLVYFADNDPDKAGKQKNGKTILSFNEMISMSDQFDIMIAVYYYKVPQLLRQLSESGIRRYCTIQAYMAERGRGIAWKN